MTFEDAKTLIDEIVKSEYDCNSWESDFIESILDRKSRLSDKQSACLQKIYDKSSGGGDYQKKEII